MRMMAFFYIPLGASAQDARYWLRGPYPRIQAEVLEQIVTIHLEDSILKAWRDDLTDLRDS